MGLSYSEVEAVLDEFIAEYWKPPLEMYGCGISVVGGHDKNAPESEAGDHCLAVSLLTTPPKGIALPDVYKGVRVFTRVVGVAHSH